MKAEKVEREQLAAIQPSSGDNNYPRPEFVSPELNASALGLRANLGAVQLALELKLIDPQIDML